jgi:5-methylcytosine-specific restriction endonuclease McrA
MNCKNCNIEFKKLHFNQKCCSDNCRNQLKKIAKAKYKKTDKGLETYKRWCENPIKKEIDKKYMQGDNAKKLAVIRSIRNLKNNTKLLEAKKIRDIEYSKTEKGKEINRIAKKKYSKTEKGMFKIKELKYIRRNKDAGVLDLQSWKEKLNKLGKKCLRCNATEKITIDHIIPLTKGGTNHIDNLQPLCWSCNSSKNNKIISYL